MAIVSASSFQYLMVQETMKWAAGSRARGEGSYAKGKEICQSVN